MSDLDRRFARLEGYLAADPSNLALFADATSTAIEAGKIDQAESLIARFTATAPEQERTPIVANLKGLVALHRGEFTTASQWFEKGLAATPNDAPMLFNLAWCKMMLGDHEGALDLVDANVVTAAKGAALLKIQLLHRLGRLDEALALGEISAAAQSGDKALASALALIAIDAEQPQMAKHYAQAAGDTHEALATLGVLELMDNQAARASSLFDAALAKFDDSARARLGKGLCLLLEGDSQGGAVELDRAASLFGEHLGTWVAAGWAYFVAGDYKSSRARFEKALALDDRFAETHGALAVLDICEGQIDLGKRRAEIAWRLDHRCFSAALAKSLLAQQAGDTVSADRIRQIALNTPIGADGRTIASTLAALSVGVRQR